MRRDLDPLDTATVHRFTVVSGANKWPPVARGRPLSPTSSFFQTDSFLFKDIGRPLVTIGLRPCVLRLDDGLGQCEVAVEVENVCVGSASLSYPQDRTIAGRQDDGTDLMGLERVAHGRPRGVNALVEKTFLDRDKKMVAKTQTKM